ncbi:MAG: class I SAM-dependent methyltransferase [Actinomycetia bacterium]|nr:class I SAM-dependent methyltransferase [Actinomycetes bacterium]
MSERDHWFEDLADHLGSAYLRYSFTKGTAQEIEFLIDVLELDDTTRVLDVGCGPGRHANALAALGVEVVGVDISERFLEVARRDAPPGAKFVRADARALDFDGEFDAVISLCQGAFGLAGGPSSRPAPDHPVLDPDLDVLRGMARALRPGGNLALSAFSAYFQVKWLEDTDTFDAASGINHELTEVRDESGRAVPAELWTTCFTPRELRLLFREAGLEPLEVWSVTPGHYSRCPPTIDLHEFLALGRRPAKT